MKSFLPESGFKGRSDVWGYKKPLKNPLPAALAAAVAEYGPMVLEYGPIVGTAAYSAWKRWRGHSRSPRLKRRK